MSQDMARHPAALPPAVDFGLRLQARVFSEPRQQPVGLEVQQVLRVQVHGPLERPVQQPNVLQTEGVGLEGDFRRGPVLRFVLVREGPACQRAGQQPGRQQDHELLHFSDS
jgi:hypothetical protein